ncbi:MAG: ABC transporter permease [Candidatus Limnocylindrales bacterium]
MSRRRVVALWRRLVQELRRDHRSMALLFVAPVVLTGLLAFVLREQQPALVTAVVVNEGGPAGAHIEGALVDALKAGGASASAANDSATAQAALKDGTASVAVILPADFAAAIAGGGQPTLTVITLGLEPSADAGQVVAVQKALAGALAQALPGGGARIPRLQPTTVYGAADADLVDNLAPVYLGFFAYFFVYILTGVSFLRERIGGTLERLLATPVARGEIVLGYSLGFGLFATVQCAVLLIWTLLDLQVPAIGPLPAFSIGLAVPVAGSPLLAYLVVLLLALGAVSLGILLSTFARTELQVIQFIPLVIVPQALLAGVLFPVSSLPSVLQPISALLPLTYAVNGLRQVVIAGADLTTRALQVDLLVLAGFAVLFAVLAGLTIRREIA